MGECVQDIKDCLRYTVTFSPETYRDAVIKLEKLLLIGDKPIAEHIKFKNFWCEEQGKTTYMGINAQVKLNPVYLSEKEIRNPMNSYFELQIHTPQSFVMKDGPGHKLYEMFRDQAVKDGNVMGRYYDGSNDEAVYNAF